MLAMIVSDCADVARLIMSLQVGEPSHAIGLGLPPFIASEIQRMPERFPLVHRTSIPQLNRSQHVSVGRMIETAAR